MISARPLVPPIVPPLAAGQVLRSLRGTARPGFAPALAAATGYAAARTFDSGRAALAALLRGWTTRGRDEVVLPAYTCWSVPASVVRAGLRVRLVDVDPATFDVAAGALDRVPLERVVAVVGAHLLGRSFDVAGAAARLRERDPAVRLVEDAAQWWPAPGAPGADAVLLSFGRGKPLAIGGGGALLFAGGAPAEANAAATRGGGLGGAAVLLGTLLLARPWLFRFAAALPFLGVGRTVYDPAFPADDALPAWQERLGLELLPRMDALVARRTAHAARLAAALDGLDGWSVPAPGRAPGPLRFPLLAPSRATRDAVLAALARLGVAGSAMYPGTLGDIPELAPHVAGGDADLPGARAIADRLLTLPCYPSLSEAAIDRVAATFRRAVREAGR